VPLRDQSHAGTAHSCPWGELTDGSKSKRSPAEPTVISLTYVSPAVLRLQRYKDDGIAEDGHSPCAPAAGSERYRARS